MDNGSNDSPLRRLAHSVPEQLLHQALTHPAFVDDRANSYERFEFLGDAVLGLAISQELHARFPEAPEGELSQLRSVVVSRDACVAVARDNDLPELMLAVAAEGTEGPQLDELAGQERVQAALVESVIGAAFLAHGYDRVAAVIVASFEDRIGHALDNRTTSKSDLQELVQRRGGSVAYDVVSVRGPEHDRRFTMRARVEPDGLSATGEGRTKKAAEQAAAERLLARLEQQ